MVTIVEGVEGNLVVVGSAGDPGQEWLIGFTPVVELLRVDDTEFPALLNGVKFSRHHPLDPVKGDRQPDEFTRVTMLVEGGPWRQRMWHPASGLDVTYQLNAPGDFVAWHPGPWHRWTPLGAATMITVNFTRVPLNATQSTPRE